MSQGLKKALNIVGVILLFLFIAYGFVPQVLSGKIVYQSDIVGYKGMSQEATSWDAQHPEDPAQWTNSMFSGMPTTMITGNDKGDWTKPVYNAFMFGRRPGSYLFISLLGAFLLMLACGISPILSIGGAIAITFCSYNFQIIQVGHNAKMVALAFAPWVLAAVIYTYKSAIKEKNLSKTLLGSALFALALDFQIKANHVQISYYLAIIILCYVAVLFVWLFTQSERQQKIKRFFIASALLLVLGLTGIATNANRLIPTYLYSKETMRGGSDLAAEGEEQSSKGLDLEYATSWSYGWQELPNMMIPNFNGGSSSGAVNPDKSETVKLLKQAGQSNYKSAAKALPMYWGPQPFTAGPMYMGAITIFLFILGLLLYKGKEKWWLLLPTLIGIGLALGHNFMPFTKFWYYHIPFYNKFRTVSMALVILQFTLPLFGFLVLDRILKQEYAKQDFKKKSLIAFAFTGIFCLLCYLIPEIAGSFVADFDAKQPEVFADALQMDRRMLLRADALMGFLLISATFLLVSWSYGKEDKSRRMITSIAVCVIVAINMWAVGKRYLNSEHFVSQREYANVFTPRPVDNYILEDDEPDYRVLDISANVFNDSFASYFHKSIGGYSPVKLQRYQDLIERNISPEIKTIYGSLNGVSTIQEAQDNLPLLPILSMLNTKYIILDGETPPVVNANAMGSCWFVSEAIGADTPLEEISLLKNVDLASVAIIGKDFEKYRDMVGPGSESDKIEITSYSPNELRYKYTAQTSRAAVFSEIFYPQGWKAKVDGDEVDLFRVNWTLRGAVLPAGSHEVVMRMDQGSYRVGSNVSRASSILLILVLIGVLIINFPLFSNYFMSDRENC